MQFLSGLFDCFEDEVDELSQGVDSLLEKYAKSNTIKSHCVQLDRLFIMFKMGIFENFTHQTTHNKAACEEPEGTLDKAFINELDENSEAMPASELNQETKEFLEQFMSRANMNMQQLALLQMRVFRRGLYCNFINGLELNQMKIAGLYAYWFNKIQPIQIDHAELGAPKLKSKQEDYLHALNEYFGFHIIYNAFIVEHGKPKHDISQYQKKYITAVRFRSFSEDGMMLLAESLGNEAFLLASRT